MMITALKNRTKDISGRRASELLLAAVIIARSTSYLFAKICMSSMGIFTILSLRFVLAFAVLAVIFGRIIRQGGREALKSGAVLGTVFFAVMTAEMYGLRLTSSSTTALLENTAVIFVPFFEALIRKKIPAIRPVICGILALAGVALITLHGGRFIFTAGMTICIIAAMLYACSIILTDRISKKGSSFAAGIWQVFFMGAFSTAAAFIFETPTLPSSSVQWLCILELTIVCSVFGFALQPVAQRGTTSERAGIMCALNPAAASVLGCVFLGEDMGVSIIIGAVLIISSVFVSGIAAKPQRDDLPLHTI